MAGPASPGTDGPTYGPPQLPPGWIAQWDGSSKKYYFVQLSTGASQWEVPTEAVATGTPAQNVDHPYGAPQPELITHPDGSQTIRHSDGTMEPILSPQDASRAADGPTGERGFGNLAVNALLGGKNSPGGHGQGHHGSSSSPLAMASQFVAGHHGGSSSKPQHGVGKIVSGIASSLLHSNNHKPGQHQHQHQHQHQPPPPPQNYHGGPGPSGHHQQQQHHSQSLGGLVGGVASFLGGKQHGHPAPNQNYGYSSSGADAGTYTGQAPPAHYQPNPHHPPSSIPPPPSQPHSQSYAPPPHPPPQGTPYSHGGPPPGAPPSSYSHDGLPGGPSPANYGSAQPPPPPASYGAPQYQPAYNQSFPPPPPAGAPQQYPPPGNHYGSAPPPHAGTYHPPPY